MNNEETISSFDFSILCEDASNEDLFEDQTHQRISDNLHNLIDKSPKGITIGLEGSWGSGKSTVINLLKEKLHSSPRDNRLFFMFDAWAHDGDPLRRIFLESLIRKIDPQEKDIELNEIKGKITGRTKTITVKAKKSTSRLGKFISLSALLIPFGTSLLNKVNYNQLVFPWSENNGPYYTFIFGLIFCLAPVVVLAYWFFYGDKDPDTKKISWEFFRVDSKEDYTQDITEDGERTSIEFEDFFRKIINTAIKNHNIEKIIIVIDNLDRVTPEHAKNVWSTLQTFFQRRSTTGTTETWPDQVWFIVPFDSYGFKKIWQSNDSDIKISESFLKKCFQLIAEVPHPVMSGWSLYVERCINLALAKWPSNEKEIVLSTYIRYASRLDKSPTPRDIRIFVNQVGLLGSMWGNQTSVEAMSLYVLFREKFSSDELRASLIANNIFGIYQPDIAHSILLPQLAGLFFGVNANKGLQLLLAPEIHTAFKTGDGNGLLKLSQDHGSAFWIAYESSRDLWQLKQDHSDEYKISFTKAIYNGLISNKTKLKHDIDNLRLTWIKSLPSLKLESNDYSESLHYTFMLCEDKNFISSINEFTSGRLIQEVNKIDGDKFSIQSIHNLIPIISFLKEYNNPIKRLSYTKLDAINWMLWLEKLNDNNIALNLVLPKSQTITSLANDVLSSNTNININYEILKYLTQTYELFKDSNEWEVVSEQVAGWLNRTSREYNCEPLYKLALMLSASIDKKIADPIKNSVIEYNFWHASSNASISANPSLPILAALSIKNNIQDHPYASSEVKKYWSNNTDDSCLDSTYSTLKNIRSLHVLWSLCKDERNITAIDIVKSNLTPELYQEINGTIFIDEFTWADEDTLTLMASNLIKYKSFSSSKKIMENNALKYERVFEIFYSINDKATSEFINNEIRKLTQEQWYRAIFDNSQLLFIVEDKNPHFSDAICRYITDLSQGDIDEECNFDFSKLPMLMKKSADLDKAIIPKITKSYFSSEQDHLSDLEFEILSHYYSSYIGNIDNILIMNRINVWIDKNKNERIEWLISQEINLNEQPLESLISRLALCYQSNDDVKISISDKLCERFNFVINSVNNESANVELI